MEESQTLFVPCSPDVGQMLCSWVRDGSSSSHIKGIVPSSFTQLQPCFVAGNVGFMGALW